MLSIEWKYLFILTHPLFKTYEIIRDYKLRINTEDQHVQKFFLVMDPPSSDTKEGEAVFSVIASRMDLTKRRMKVSQDVRLFHGFQPLCIE